jgi:protein-tyrosine phosphatase
VTANNGGEPRPTGHAAAVIDLHTHILPGIDDGPETLADAIELARATLAAGVDEVVATPHVSGEHPNGPDEILAALALLRGELVKHELPLRVHAGAEIAADRALSLGDATLRQLRLGGGPYILLECPLRTTSDIEPIVAAIQTRGHRVVLAHPERSPLLQRDVAQLTRMVAGGALTSLTSVSFSGGFGSTVQRFAQDLLDGGLVHNLASDMHHIDRRPPGIAAPTTDGQDDRRSERLAWLASRVPAAILAGTPVPFGPAPPTAKRAAGRWARLRRA